ncbi:MAG: universal stress protein [Pyrinomonadaceae bacterium]
MKLLIAYDGSKCAEAAIDDLARAGLPEKGSATVVSVAEVWLPPKDSVEADADGSSANLEELVRAWRDSANKSIAEAAMLARHAERRVARALPNWEVRSEALHGSPAWEILDAARNCGADLIVVGSQGHSALGHLVLGSISQKVLAEAPCSVRVARGRIDVDPAPERIVIGFDASRGAAGAVTAAAGRNWSRGAAVRLIAVTEPVVPKAIGRFVAPSVNASAVSSASWLERAAETALRELRGAGIESELMLRAGNPKHVLVDEAERWGADAIFLGATRYGSSLERLILGGTAAAVAARARCTVEVVRIAASGSAR